MRGSNRVTSRQVALLTFVAQTGVGITTLPSIIAKEVGHDGWISVAIAGIIAVTASLLINMLLRRYADKSIFDINKLILGNLLGKALNVLLVLYVILTASAGVRVFTLFLRLTLLPKSPPLIMSPFVLLPSVFLVWQGLKNVCRFKYISFISYITAITYIALISEDIRVSFLMPVGESGIMTIMSGLRTAMLSYMGVELIAFVFPEIADKKNAMKWHAAANILSVLFLVLVVAVSIAVFGERLVQTFTVPLFNLARIYHAPVVERVDLYITALWFVAMGCSMRAYMFVGFYSIQKVFNVKQTKPFLVAFFIALVLISRIPRDLNQVFIFTKIINHIGLGVIGFIALCLPVSFIRTKGVKTFEGNQ